MALQSPTRHPSFKTGFALSAIVLAVSCSAERPRVPMFSAELEVIYQEPKESARPWLINSKDLVLLGDRVYVLDGRLSEVAAFDVQNGTPILRFGGNGEGPGELGGYPLGLVTIGDHIGAIHLGSISWFNKDGDFINRESLPTILDYSSPSLHYSTDGIVFNVGYQGEDSPLAAYISEKDTVWIGEASAPVGDAHPLTANIINAVHVARFPNGNFLLAHIQHDRIGFYSSSGLHITTDSWGDFSKKMQRNERGLLWGHPGLALSVTLDDSGTAYVLGGESSQTVRAYSSDGVLIRIYSLDTRTFRIAWKNGDVAYALTGGDNLYRVRITDQKGEAGAR